MLTVLQEKNCNQAHYLCTAKSSLGHHNGVRNAYWKICDSVDSDINVGFIVETLHLNFILRSIQFVFWCSY